jgi:hypothetical protein
VIAPLLTPLDSPIFDEDVIAVIEDHLDDEVACEAPRSCTDVAVARFVVLCTCRKSRLGCARHIAQTKRWFDEGGIIRCLSCRVIVTSYRVVPL